MKPAPVCLDRLAEDLAILKRQVGQLARQIDRHALFLSSPNTAELQGLANQLFGVVSDLTGVQAGVASAADAEREASAMERAAYITRKIFGMSWTRH